MDRWAPVLWEVRTQHSLRMSPFLHRHCHLHRLPQTCTYQDYNIKADTQRIEITIYITCKIMILIYRFTSQISKVGIGIKKKLKSLLRKHWLEIVHRRNESSSTNSGNLCSKIVDFGSGERRVTDYSLLQITGEELLDLSSTHNLGWSYWRQFRPFCARLIADKVCLFVATSAGLFLGDYWRGFVIWCGQIVFVSLFRLFCFLISWLLSFFLFSFLFLFPSFSVFYLT